MVDVLVVAGGNNGEKLHKFCDTEYKALIPIGNYIMVDLVLKSVNKSDSVEKVVVIGPKNQLEKNLSADYDLLLDNNDTLAENVIKGASYLNQNGEVLVITGDIPLLTSEAIDDFISRSKKQEPAGVYYSLIKKETIEKSYPQSSRTYFKLKEGTFTGGNVALMKTKKIQENIDTINEVTSLRKSPWQLVRLLGLKCLCKFIAGKLSLEDIQERFQEILDIKGFFIISPFAEIGIDVDKVEDLKVVRNSYIKSHRQHSQQKSG